MWNYCSKLISKEEGIYQKNKFSLSGYIGTFETGISEFIHTFVIAEHLLFVLKFEK